MLFLLLMAVLDNSRCWLHDYLVYCHANMGCDSLDTAWGSVMKCPICVGHFAAVWLNLSPIFSSTLL